MLLLTVPLRPGIVAVLPVLLGSTAFDSFSASPGWRSFVDDLPVARLPRHPAVRAILKVASMVAGHIGAMVAAHDSALRLLPQGHQITGQLAMMLSMVAYNFTGLYLLYGG